MVVVVVLVVITLRVVLPINLAAVADVIPIIDLHGQPTPFPVRHVIAPKDAPPTLDKDF